MKEKQNIEELLKRINENEQKDNRMWSICWHNNKILLVEGTNLSVISGHFEKYYKYTYPSKVEDFHAGNTYWNNAKGGYGSCLRFIKNYKENNKWATWKCIENEKIDLLELAKDPRVIICDRNGNKVNEGLIDYYESKAAESQINIAPIIFGTLLLAGLVIANKPKAKQRIFKQQQTELIEMESEKECLKKFLKN